MLQEVRWPVTRDMSYLLIIWVFVFVFVFVFFSLEGQSLSSLTRRCFDICLSASRISPAFSMLNQFFPNLDIWNEILGYFEVSLGPARDNKRVAREKRKASLAITLLSPWLTELALDVLWKDMTTLVPIVSVANSGGEFIDYRVSDGRGCWVSHIRLESSES